MKNIWIIVSYCLAVAFAIGLTHFAMLDGIDGLFFRCLVGSEDTVYAPGYEASSFQGIRKGMTQSEVTHQLGEPLERIPMLRDSSANDGWWYRRSGSNAEGWSYSQSENDSHYRKRIVVFRDGKVVDKIANFYVD